MSLEHLQQLADRPIVRNRITHRLNSLEPELTIGVALHDAALAWPLPIRVLHVVVARRVRLPNVDPDVGDGVAARVADRAENQHRLAGRVGRHACARGDGGCVVRVEGAQDGSFGARGGFGVVDGVYEERKTKDIRK